MVGACAVAILLGVAWRNRIIHDESLSPESGSLAYRLLVPDELKQERLAAFGAVREYEYAAAVGPEPTITLVRVETRESGAASREAIAESHTALGFPVTGPGHLVRGRTGPEISGDRTCAANCRLTRGLSQHW